MNQVVFRVLLPMLLLPSLTLASVPLGAPKKAAGGKADLYGCMQSNDYYIANFAAYQLDVNRAENDRTIPEPECVDLPRIGKTQIAVDMLDRDVRRKPVAMKITAADGRVLAETPMAEPKQGVLSTEVNFPTPGHYQIALYINDTDLNLPLETGALRIPLAVAVAPQDKPAPQGGLTFLFVGLGLFIAAVGWLTPRLLKPQAET